MNICEIYEHIISKHSEKFMYKGGITVKTLDAIVLTLVIIGAINWGLIGFFNFNLVDTLFGSVDWLTKTIYAIVGIAGVYSIAFYGREGQRDY